MPGWVRVAMIAAAVMALAAAGAVFQLQAYVYEHGLNVNLKVIALTAAALGFTVAFAALVLAIRSRRARSGCRRNFGRLARVVDQPSPSAFSTAT
jgi:hypothetical protein